MPENKENLRQLAKNLKKHPQYKENPQVRAIVDEYRERLLDPALGAVEVSNVLNAIRGSLADYLEKGEDPIESLLPDLRLREQYEAQLNVARKSGLFADAEFDVEEQGPEGTDVNKNVPLFIREGRIFSMPIWNDVRKVLLENKEVIEEKSRQGFTKMLIVPFAYDLGEMQLKFRNKIEELDKAGGVVDGNGNKFNFNKIHRDFVTRHWREHDLVYEPKRFDKIKHGGMAKTEAIALNGGWQICFVENAQIIPESAEWDYRVGGRKPIALSGSEVVNVKHGGPLTPQDYKEALDYKAGSEGDTKFLFQDSYHYESGLVPEQYIWMQLTSLLSKDHAVLMDFSQGHDAKGTYLIGCYDKGFGEVLIGSVDANSEIVLGEVSPVNQNAECGIRTAVNIR